MLNSPLEVCLRQGQSHRVCDNPDTPPRTGEVAGSLPERTAPGQQERELLLVISSELLHWRNTKPATVTARAGSSVLAYRTVPYDALPESRGGPSPKSLPGPQNAAVKRLLTLLPAWPPQGARGAKRAAS